MMILSLDEETEAQGSETSYPYSHSLQVVRLGFEPRQFSNICQWHCFKAKGCQAGYTLLDRVALPLGRQT